MISDSNQEFVTFENEESIKKTESEKSQIENDVLRKGDEENEGTLADEEPPPEESTGNYDVIAERPKTSKEVTTSLDLEALGRSVDTELLFGPRIEGLFSGTYSIDVGSTTLQETASKKSSEASVKAEEKEKDEEEQVGADKLKEEDVRIDRGMYYEMYALYTGKYYEAKQRNNYFHTQLAEYYKRKRMYHVLYTDKQTLPDYQKKYDKLLAELERIQEENAREEHTMKHEVESLKMKRLVQEGNVKQLFVKLQNAEKDFAKELTNYLDERGKANAEKHFHHLLKRQRQGVNDLSRIRLEYLKLYNKYNETQQVINELDRICSKFRLVDYEQLKSDNRNLLDRLEEKELELTTIRKRCQNTMQILAHIREKVDALNTKIQSEADSLEGVSYDWMDAREHLTGLKCERDNYRSLIKKFKEEAGLLLRPKLLRDMERSIHEIEEVKAKIVKYQKEYATSAQLLTSLRKRSSSLLLGEAKAQDLLPKKLTS